MKKYFIVADVHGHYYEMYAALDKAGFSPHNNDHIFISLGDLLDRGNKPLECLQFVMSIPENQRILIRGNHEDLIEDCIANKRFKQHDVHNGTMETCVILTDRQYEDEYTLLKELENHELLQSYLKSTVDSYETSKSICVHGWIPGYSSSNQFVKIENPDWYDWRDARWINGMDAYRFGGKVDGKTVYCGHWHTSYGWSIIKNKCSEFGQDAIFDMFEDDGICALDACTAYTYKINCKVVEGEDFE